MEQDQLPAELQNLIDNDHVMSDLPEPLGPDPAILDEDPPTPLQDEEIMNLDCSRELLPDPEMDGDPTPPLEEAPAAPSSDVPPSSEPEAEQ